jgi:hypothetical protein
MIGATEPHMSLWVRNKVAIPQSFMTKLEDLKHSLASRETITANSENNFKDSYNRLMAL